MVLVSLRYVRGPSPRSSSTISKPGALDSGGRGSSLSRRRAAGSRSWRQLHRAASTRAARWAARSRHRRSGMARPSTAAGRTASPAACRRPGERPARMIPAIARTRAFASSVLEAVKRYGGAARVDQLAVAVVGLSPGLRDVRRRSGSLAQPLLAGPDDRHDRQAERGRELVVPLIVRGDRHDGPRAVAGEHVVRDQDRQLRARRGVHGVAAEEHGCLGALALALPVTGRGGAGDVRGGRAAAATAPAATPSRSAPRHSRRRPVRPFGWP